MIPLASPTLGLIAGAADTLPVSVAAHLLVARAALSFAGAHAAYHDLVVQLGTCVGVGVMYARILTRRLLVLLALASIPTLLLSGIVASVTTRLLYAPRSIALALLVGGIACIAMTRRREDGAAADVTATTARQAAIIGLIHPVSFWPGTSHVLIGWLGGRIAGLSSRAAYDFALLLSLGSIAPVCLVNAIGGWHRLPGDDRPALAAILVAAAIGAACTIALVRRLSIRRVFAVLGGYRIALAAIVFGVVAP